jgi:hypothetical protein
VTEPVPALPPHRTLCSVVDEETAAELEARGSLPAGLLEGHVPLLSFDGSTDGALWGGRLRALGRRGRWRLVVFELDTPEGIEPVSSGPLAPCWQVPGPLPESRTLNGFQLLGTVHLDSSRW